MELEDRNPKPEETSQNLPMAVLITLVGIVCLMLYVGWQMISDEPSKVSDINPEMQSAPKEEVNQEAEDVEVIVDEVPDIEMPKATTKTIPTATETPKAVTKSTGKGINYTHKVAAGETFFSIATRYNLSTATLQSNNKSVNASSIKGGSTKLTIPIQAIHTVGPGDIIRVVAGKYGVSVEQIMKANAKTKNFAKRGEELIIPFAKKQ
jgi:LysM repeat protein